MKIIHFTYTITGGAGITVSKFHRLLKKNGYKSAIINVKIHKPEDDIYIITALQALPRKFMNLVRYWAFRSFARLRYKKNKQYNFNYNYNYRGITFKEIKKSVPLQPDIIFLHWIADFITPVLIQQMHEYYKCPIIWRYNDLAPVTGGCHYTAGCENYKTGCGYCPAIESKIKNDWSHRFWEEKNSILPGINLTVINSTHHTEAVFKASPLFKNKTQVFIRNSLPHELYDYTGDKKNFREQFQIAAHKKVIFWGATHVTEQRKGFSFFLESLREIKLLGNTDWLVIIAGNKPADFNPGIPFEHRFTGLLSEKELVSWYKASEAVVCTSIEDGGPMMIVESMMCGTPVVSFPTGLALELVITGETGYRAERSNAKDLTKGLLYVLNLHPAEYQSLSNRCYQKAISLYGEETEITAYKKLFAELL